MNQQETPCDDWQATNKRNALRLAWWTAAWVITMAIAVSNLDVTNLIAFDAEISHLVILMALTYMVGIATGVRRYR